MDEEAPSYTLGEFYREGRASGRGKIKSLRSDYRASRDSTSTLVTIRENHDLRYHPYMPASKKKDAACL